MPSHRLSDTITLLHSISRILASKATHANNSVSLHIRTSSVVSPSSKFGVVGAIVNGISRAGSRFQGEVIYTELNHGLSNQPLTTANESYVEVGGSTRNMEGERRNPTSETFKNSTNIHSDQQSQPKAAAGINAASSSDSTTSNAAIDNLRNPLDGNGSRKVLTGDRKVELLGNGDQARLGTSDLESDLQSMNKTIPLTQPTELYPQQQPQQNLTPSRVPTSRISRLYHYTSLIAGLGVGALSESIQRATGKQGTQSLLLSDSNVERIVKRLTRMRGAALKLGQMLSIQGMDSLCFFPKLIFVDALESKLD